MIQLDHMEIKSTYLNRGTEIVQFEEVFKNQINTFIEDYFKKPLQDGLFHLYGGHSDAKNYFFEMDGAPYILRVENPNVPLELNLRELFSFKGAMKNGVAPKIYSISSDSSFVLIEYLNIPTLSLQNAKSHLSSLALSLSKIHAIPINPYATQTQVEEFLGIYRTIKQENRLREFEAAVSELPNLEKHIHNFQGSPATLHGDLHPRNLFLTNEKQLLAVDWEMTNVDDPFYDLAYCSVLHDLNGDDEYQLLTAYLKGKPSSEDLKRYALCRRASLIFLSILCFSQAQESAKIDCSILKADAPLKGWTFYIKGWSEKGEHEAQFFYDWGRECLSKLLVP